MRYGVREIADVVIKDIVTRKPKLYLETLKVTSSEVKNDKAYAKGGISNPKRLAWQSNKEVMYKMQDALISPESLAMLVGTSVITGAVIAHKKQVLTLDSNKKVVIASTPTVNTDLFIFETAEGYDVGDEVIANASTGYAISGREITFGASSGLSDGDMVIVDYYYTSTANSKTITISSDEFPGYYILEASTLWKRESDGQDVPALYTLPKVQFDGSFTIAQQADGDPSVFDFNLEAFPNSDNEMEIIQILE